MKVDINKIIENKEYCEKAFKHYLKIKVLKRVSEPSSQKNVNKALSNLEFGNFILEEHNFSIKEKLSGKHFYDWCIIIYYYAMYHITLALIEKLGYKSKSHIATLAAATLFYYHKDNLLKREDIEFIIDKIDVEKEELDMVVEAKNMRERACYGTDEVFELAMAKRLQEQTADFVNRIRGLLEEEAQK